MSAVKTASEVIHLALEQSEGVLPEGEYLKLANALKAANTELNTNRKARGRKIEGMEIRGEGTITGSPVSAKLVFFYQEFPRNMTPTWELSVGEERPVMVSTQSEMVEFLVLHEPYTLKVSGLGPTFTTNVPKMMRQMELHHEEEAREREWDEDDYFISESDAYRRLAIRLEEQALNKLVVAFPIV